MPPDERDGACLWDMLFAAREAHALIDGREAGDVIAERMRLRALERTLEIVGEAARRVSPAYQSECSDIDWRGLIGLRTVLAHEYGRINHQLLFDTASRRLPDLIVTLDGLVRGLLDPDAP